MSKLTITDDITSLYNSRHLHTLLQQEIDRAQELGNVCSLIFFDLDFFKKVNDTHGHLCGSSLLAEMGRIVADMLGTKYFGARYGGDEFVVILRDTSKQEALAFCRQLQETLNSHVFLVANGLAIHITASFGIATFPDDGDNNQQILHLADERMYKVKGGGRNDIAWN